MTIYSGCGTPEGRLSAASGEIGRQNAGLKLPALPPRCREKVPRVTPKAGEKWRSVQGRWELVADSIDRRTIGCAEFYDELRTGLL